jgi:hypothetical protein
MALRLGTGMPVHVRGYRRKDGTPVRSYVRRSPVRTATAAITVGVTITIAANLSPFDASSSLRVPRIKVEAQAKADFNKSESRFRARGYKVNLDVRFDTDCAAHSYGKVHDFFILHSCVLLSRAAFTLRDKYQDAILVAISWVSMPDTALAERYKSLVDTWRTGNVTELSREIGPYKNVRFTGKNYTSGLDGKTVWNAQVQPTLRPVDLTVIKALLAASRQ